jgi:hypothetical protein
VQRIVAHVHAARIAAALAFGLVIAAALTRVAVAAPGPAGCGTGSWIAGTVDAPALGIRHDRAYWVHDIVGRGAAEDEYFDVELTSWGCGGSLDQTAVTFPAQTGDDPVPWTSQEGAITGQTPLAQQNRIEGHLLDVASAGIDGSIGGACIDPATPLSYRITTDGPAQITISGYRQLQLPAAGTHEGVLLPEPSAAAGLAGGAALLAALARRRGVVLGGGRSS